MIKQLALASLVAGFLAACATPSSALMGNISADNDAMKLAVSCKIDAAVGAANKAIAGGGVGEAMGYVVKHAILGDANRWDQRFAVKNDYLKRYGNNVDSADKLEKQSSEVLAKIKAERLKLTGKAGC